MYFYTMYKRQKIPRKTEIVPIRETHSEYAKHQLGNFAGMKRMKMFVGHDLAKDPVAAGIALNRLASRIPRDYCTINSPSHARPSFQQSIKA